MVCASILFLAKIPVSLATQITNWSALMPLYPTASLVACAEAEEAQQSKVKRTSQAISVFLCIVLLGSAFLLRYVGVRMYRLDEPSSNSTPGLFALDSPFPLALFYAQLILRRRKMKTWIAAILVSVSLGGSAWGQSPRPQTAADLGKYLGADRERLLYEGAKRRQACVVHIAHAVQGNRQDL